MKHGFRIPPLGFGGAAQQTPAVMALTRAVGARMVRTTTGTRRRARPVKRRAATTTRRAKAVRSSARRRSVGRKARLVKGSAAARRYMAKIRGMRKRRR